MALTEYESGKAFPGVIGRTTDESSPAWPRPLRAEPGSPNVLFIVLDDTGYGQRPQIAEPRTSYTFRPGTQTVPAAVGPRIPNRPHAVTADVDIPAGGAEGVLLSQGTGVGGWSFYLADGKLHYVHNYVRRAIYHVSSPDAVPAGRHRLRFEFEPTGKPGFAQGKGSPGRAQLYVDGHLVAQAEFPVTTPVAFNPGGLTCGANPGTPVTPAYRAPFRFTGILHTVTVDLSGDLITDTEGEMRMAMARQ